MKKTSGGRTVWGAFDMFALPMAGPIVCVPGADTMAASDRLGDKNHV